MLEADSAEAFRRHRRHVGTRRVFRGIGAGTVLATIAAVWIVAAATGIPARADLAHARPAAVTTETALPVIDATVSDVGAGVATANSGAAAAPASEAVVQEPAVEAAPAQAAAPAAPVTGQLTPTGPSGYTIDIALSGWQAEVDQCVWVRMDLGATAPIVGAHSNCGGHIVLDMVPGDIITLTGHGLNGTYRVAGSRDAHPGDDAATATEGMTAAVILQTCYLDRDGVRLVTLLPEASSGTSPPP